MAVKTAQTDLVAKGIVEMLAQMHAGAIALYGIAVAVIDLPADEIAREVIGNPVDTGA